MEIFILVVTVFYVALKCLIDMSQIVFINNYKMTNDEINKLELNANDYNEARDYNKSKLFLSLCKLVIEALVIYTFIISDGLLWMNDNIALHNLFIPHEYILLIIFFTLLFAIKLPLSFYSTFYIESKYGFNSMTKKLFLRDSIITYILTTIVIVCSFYIFEVIFYNFNQNWWLIFWLCFLIFNFLLIIIYPNYIAPIFNRFDRISDKKLLENIDELTKKSRFEVDDIFVMDGSKRSKHSNAYFTGLFGKKRIVFFDTLLESLTYDEIKSVLAHEIGHYKMKHIQKSLVISMIISFIYFYIFYQITQNLNLLSSYNLATVNIAVLFIILTPVLLFFINPFLSNLSRMNEYEADNFAKKYSNGQALKSSLLKLYKDNFSLVKSSNLYTFFYHTHPTVYERIINLNKKI